MSNKTGIFNEELRIVSSENQLYSKMLRIYVTKNFFSNIMENWDDEANQQIDYNPGLKLKIGINNENLDSTLS